MKQIVYSILFLFCLHVTAYGQQAFPEIGVKAGFNLANFNGGYGFFGNRPGFHVGMFAKKSISAKAYYQTRTIVFSKRGLLVC